MNRNVTELEQKLINDGWYLSFKSYQGKHSEKTLCYEYHKTADLRLENKTFDQVIKLDTKREHVVNYGVLNPDIELLDQDTMTFVRGLFITLRDYVARITNEEKSPYEKAHEMAENYLAENPSFTPCEIFDDKESEQ